MTSLWPWLAIAGLGALHGLNPATGWMFAAAWGVQAHDGAQARRALWSIGLGHAVSVAVVACALVQGLAMDRTQLQPLGGVLLVAAALSRLLCGSHEAKPVSAPAGHAGMAAWSFLMATTHGAGLMLVPALMPLCLGTGAGAGTAGRIDAAASLWLAGAAVLMHTAGMLVCTGLVATGVCRGVGSLARWRRPAWLRGAWTVALAGTGLVLLCP